MSEWNFYIFTFGCKVNQYESQSLREHWQSLGGTETGSVADADYVLINSCAVTAKAVRDARAALYRTHREAPNSTCILTGCSARLLNREKDIRELCHAIYSVPEKHLLLCDPRTITRQDSRDFSEKQILQTYPPFSISSFHRARPVLKVQDGCSHGCTYCIVCKERPTSVSRPIEDAVKEARRLFEAGYREIMISGINLFLFGRDLQPATDFWNLIETLDAALAPEWAGRARFRISSLEPRQLNERGLEVLSKCRMLCPHLHISLQSGSHAVLKRMGRGQTCPEILVNAVKTISGFWHRFALGADILTGFPGETEADAADTLALVHELPFTYAHVFPYSRRPGTPAAAFAEQIPHEKKTERAAKLRNAIALKAAAFHKATLLSREILLIAPDKSETRQQKGFFKGTEQCYVTCQFDTPPNCTGNELIRAEAVEVTDGGLLVRPLQADIDTI